MPPDRPHAGGTSHHSLQLKIFLVFAAFYLLLIGVLFLFPPRLIALATVVTERLDVAIDDGAKAAFPVDGFRMAVQQTDGDGRCARGLLIPATGSELQLTRVGDGAVAVQLFRPAASGPGPTAVFSPTDGADAPLEGTLSLESGACPPGRPVRAADLQIPVWGRLTIGQEFRPVADGGPRDGTMLLEGHLQVMAESIVRFFPKLYPVADLALPVGTRVEALAPQGGADSSNWWGLVYPDPQHPALVAQLATDARGILLHRPNLSGGQEIRISVLEELFTDPNLVWFHFFAGALFVFGQIAGFIAEWVHATRQKRVVRPRMASRFHRQARRGGTGKAPPAKFLALLMLAACGLSGLPARADAVRVILGDNAWGEGWRFLDLDGICKVATAAHVVQGPGGTYTAPRIEGGDGHFWMPGPPLVLPTTDDVAAGRAPDVAVLPLPAAMGRGDCGDGRLSGIGLERRVARPDSPRVLTWGSSEIVPHRAEVTAAAADRGNGTLFAVRPTDAARVVEGWSGSPLVDEDGLLGIVFAVDAERNEALVVRADVVRRLVDTAASASAPASAPVSGIDGIGLLGGSSPDPAHGPGQLGGDGWRIAPTGSGTVALQITPRLAPGRPAPLSSVTLSSVTLGFGAGDGARVRGLEVYSRAAADVGEWAGAASCRPGGGDREILDCRFVSRPVAALQLILHVSGSAPLVLSRIDLR